MQDFTGVPAVVDLAAMRDAMVALGSDPNKINPLSFVAEMFDCTTFGWFSLNGSPKQLGRVRRVP